MSVGRPRDTVLEHLNAGARLVTLLGPGGAGKTRLAIEVTRSLAPQNQVRGFVDCSAITDVSELPQALTRLLDLRVREAGQHLPALIHALQDGLLVLDNLEQLEDSPILFLSQLLQQCPGLKLIATSRVRLQIPGEVVLRLEGLPQEQATELFLQRAMAAGANRSALDSTTIETLCARLDGLPLALELAATWCSLLSPGDIEPIRHPLRSAQRAKRGAGPGSHSLLELGAPGPNAAGTASRTGAAARFLDQQTCRRRIGAERQ
ncbi:MAG: NACHT domain-containing protein [Armatimonas sp.]